METNLILVLVVACIYSTILSLLIYYLFNKRFNKLSKSIINSSVMNQEMIKETKLFIQEWVYEREEKTNLRLSTLEELYKNLDISVDEREEKTNLRLSTLEELYKNLDISVDVHEHKFSNSWAVISIQGKKTDYIKFIDLGNSEIREIAQFLRRLEKVRNIKVDASPLASPLLRIEKDK